jgi:xanthine dehydrogenase large subunit
VLPPVHVTRGDAAAALARAPHRLRGTASVGGQDHFYLEGQIALAVPREHGGIQIYTSTQHPVKCSTWSRVRWGSPRMTSSSSAADGRRLRRQGNADVALRVRRRIIARKTGRAAKLRLDRDDDMRSTGKRHAFTYAYDVGFDDDGRILGLDLTLASRCGFSADLSGPVNDRAVFHCDNAYWLPDVAVHSFRCKTNTVSDTAFRGFGGPQGHVPDRAGDRRSRARAPPRPARRAHRQSLRHDHAQPDAVRHGRRRQRRARDHRAARGFGTLPATAPRDRAVESR